MSQAPDRSELLGALDETPQTAQRLARRLETDPDTVHEALEDAQDEGLVADWGNVWATTWRAKLSLSPRFFRIWIPASIALGAGLTALALRLNAPEPVGWEAVGGLVVVAVIGALLAGFGLVRGGD